MSRSELSFVLACASPRAEPHPEGLDSRGATVAARFWAGKHQGSHAKAACVERILAVWRDRTRVAGALATLRPQERETLAVVKRYGGAISGTLLERELVARGVLRATAPEEWVPRRNQPSADPVLALCDRLVLVRAPGYYDSYSYGLHRKYPAVTLPAPIAELVEPAEPLGWKAVTPEREAPDSASKRAFAQVLVDLEQTARALEGLRGWKVNQGGGLPAPIRTRLARSRPATAGDPFDPPDGVALDYSLLCALGAVEIDGDGARLRPERADELFRRPPARQVWEWVRAWMGLRLWQDGVGAVPDRDGRENPTRIDPDRLRTARELLVWALTRVAHDGEGWLDLETFVLDLYAATAGRGISLYWDGFAWEPHFAAAAGKDGVERGPERLRAFWMDREGAWAANALLSTLVYLGVVERGRSGGARSPQWSFRLTELGSAVLGAPEVEFGEAAGGRRCLTVQPNHEILLYLDEADGEVVRTMGQIAARASSAGPVQTYKLTRESVYAALEGGLTPAAIESFLSSRTRCDLPANVSQSLSEWSRKRDALVVRSSVALVAGFAEGQDALHGAPRGAQVVVAAPTSARRRARELDSDVGSATASRDWSIDELGVVSPRGPMSLVAKARLRRLAGFTKGEWRIAPETVRAARALGIAADQILEWLGAHSSQEVPLVLATAIRNWSGRPGRAFLGDVVLLQVEDPKAFEALCRSELFRPMVRGTLAPGCFLVPAGMRKEAARILRDLGFALGTECALASVDGAK